MRIAVRENFETMEPLTFISVLYLDFLQTLTENLIQTRNLAHQHLSWIPDLKQSWAWISITDFVFHEDIVMLHVEHVIDLYLIWYQVNDVIDFRLNISVVTYT